jgi:peptidoglycan/LPS O-acetylase OafA/YrhL
MELSMILIAVHLAALVQHSAPKPKGDWLNWTIGVIVVIAVIATMYWLTVTKPRRRRRRKERE